MRVLLALVLAAVPALPAAGGGARREPGPWAVGFRQSWELDAGRRYATAFDGGAAWPAGARPVLVNLWYPAAPEEGAEPMPHGRYLALAADEPGLARFAAALAAHARAIVADEVLGAPEGELDDAGRAALEDLLGAPTACHDGAPAARGPFPVVLYHSGAGSSFEDDALLCEHLASHGYVVLGSAYPKADGSSLGIDGDLGSAADAQVLVRFARGLAFADATRVGLVGHSAGAQALLKAASQPGAACDALVLLDTTQDYYDLSMPLYERLIEETTRNVAGLTEPLLVVAGPEALFALCDTFVGAERTYVTVPDLGHDEYVSQGLQRLAALERRGGPEWERERERAPLVRARYAALNELVRLFFDAHLRGAPAGFEARRAELERGVLGADMHAERVARGASAPPPFDREAGRPPTPRELLQLASELDGDALAALLARFADRTPQSPIYTSTMLSGSLLHRLVAAGRADDARTLHGFYRARDVDALGVFDFLTDLLALQGKEAEREALLSVGLTIDPQDARLAAKARALAAGEGE